MKKFKSIICSLFLVIGLSACQKEAEVLDQNKVYETDEVTLQFKAMHTVENVNPVNQNDEYFYRYSTEKGVEIIDVQFYVENKTDKEIDVNDSITGKLSIDKKESDVEVCVEDKHYTDIDESGKLSSKEKSIAHVMFYVDQDELKEIKEQENASVELTIGGNPYTITIDEIDAKEEKIDLIQTLKFEKFDFMVLSGSASKIIPAFNFEAEDMEWYETDEDDKQYAGGYAEITNKTDKPINIMEEIAVYLSIEDGEQIPAWWSVLTKDEAKFEEKYEIGANETRKVLFFVEIDLDYEDTNYTFHFNVDGKPYAYTYKHLVVSR